MIKLEPSKPLLIFEASIKHEMLKDIIFVFEKDKQVMVMVFNATFNNISVISWRSVLLVEETEIPRENH
jgi:hypothetical protein